MKKFYLIFAFVRHLLVTLPADFHNPSFPVIVRRVSFSTQLDSSRRAEYRNKVVRQSIKCGLWVGQESKTYKGVYKRQVQRTL